MTFNMNSHTSKPEETRCITIIAMQPLPATVHPVILQRRVNWVDLFRAMDWLLYQVSGENVPFTGAYQNADINFRTPGCNQFCVGRYIIKIA